MGQGKSMESNSHADKAYEALRQMIIDRTLRPGASLAVPELAEQMRMSVTPLREAIRRLDAEGLLEVIPRRGTFVKNFTLEDLVIGYETAEAVEGMASYLVAELAQQGEIHAEELDALDALVDEMEQYMGESQAAEWGVLDSRFHADLCQLSRNRNIWQISQQIKNQMNCVLWFITPLYVDRNNSMREHRKILDAIRRGAADEARTLTQNHKNRVRGVLLKLLS